MVSSFRLGEIVRTPDASGRIAKWSMELTGETLTYAPRKAIKSQILQTSSLNAPTLSCPRCRFRLSVGPCTSMGQ
jgi:hypothetical protein